MKKLRTTLLMLTLLALLTVSVAADSGPEKYTVQAPPLQSVEVNYTSPRDPATAMSELQHLGLDSAELQFVVDVGDTIHLNN